MRAQNYLHLYSTTNRGVHVVFGGIDWLSQVYGALEFGVKHETTPFMRGRQTGTLHVRDNHVFYRDFWFDSWELIYALHIPRSNPLSRFLTTFSQNRARLQSPDSRPITSSREERSVDSIWPDLSPRWTIAVDETGYRQPVPLGNIPQVVGVDTARARGQGFDWYEAHYESPRTSVASEGENSGSDE